MYVFPSFSMEPHSGVGGCTPKLRKLRPAADSMTYLIPLPLPFFHMQVFSIVYLFKNDFIA